MSERRTNLVAEPGERVECDTFAGTKIGKVLAARTHWYKGGGHSNIYEVEFTQGGLGSYREESVRKPTPPTAKDLAGSDPDFTGEQSTDEHLRELREG